MEEPKRIADRTNISLEELPLDVHLHILDFLPLKDSARSLLRVSKILSEIVRDALSMGKKNSLDCLLTGTQKSGTTTLFWLLSQDKNTLLNLHQNQDQEQPALPLKKEGMEYIKRINIEDGRTAVIFHGSNHPSRRKNMFPYYGLTQCMVFVIPAQIPQEEAELTLFKNDLKEQILPAYALCGHMNWLFVINKMDLVEYSEKAFNDVSAIILDICKKISEHIHIKISLIPISAVNSVNIYKDTKYGNNNPLSWYEGPTLVEKLCQVSAGVQIPYYKFFRRPSFAVIGTREATPTRQKKKLAGDNRKVLIGYVTDGFFDTTEKFYMQPNAYRLIGHKFDMGPRLAFNIDSIKSFNSAQRSAMAGSFIGVEIRLDIKTEIEGAPLTPQNVIRYGHPYRPPINFVKKWFTLSYLHGGDIMNAKPHYHRYSTTKDFVRVISAEVQLVMLASKSGVQSCAWNGELRVTTSAGFYAQGVKTQARITKIISVQDKHGSTLKDAEKVVKGQKATVQLSFRFPIHLQIYNKAYSSENYPNSDGRFLFYLDKRVIAVGIVTGVTDFKKEGGQRVWAATRDLENQPW